MFCLKLLTNKKADYAAKKFEEITANSGEIPKNVKSGKETEFSKNQECVKQKI